MRPGREAESMINCQFEHEMPPKSEAKKGDAGGIHAAVVRKQRTRQGRKRTPWLASRDGT